VSTKGMLSQPPTASVLSSHHLEPLHKSINGCLCAFHDSPKAWWHQPSAPKPLLHIFVLEVMKSVYGIQREPHQARQENGVRREQGLGRLEHTYNVSNSVAFHSGSLFKITFPFGNAIIVVISLLDSLPSA
jgi:hypothetical protein